MKNHNRKWRRVALPLFLAFEQYVGLVRLWPAILLLLLYYVAIMMDSGALTAGVVKESDDQNRGSILAAYSMFGFVGSIIGPPMVGFVLDWSGGLESYTAWKWGLVAMAAGSFAVFIVQNTLSKTNR